MNIDCVSRGDVIGEDKCPSCRGHVAIKVFACPLHESCTLQRKTKHWVCATCQDRQPVRMVYSFAGMKNRHEGQTAWVIGAGKTRFDYQNLRNVSDSVFFINMGADAEKHVHHLNTYFFALDVQQRAYLPYFQGISCLTIGPQFREQDTRGTRRIMKWRNTPKGASHLLDLSRDEIAVTTELYRGKEGHSGTIMPLIHFAWFMGIKRLNLVGCDGLAVGYDERLTNRTGQVIDRKQTGVPVGIERFGRFREHQDWLMSRLGIESEYVGTPQ